VKLIRLQWADQTVVNTFNQDVSVGIAENRKTQTDYLTINVNGQVEFAVDLSSLLSSFPMNSRDYPKH
jgi:hypothetical protein